MSKASNPAEFRQYPPTQFKRAPGGRIISPFVRLRLSIGFALLASGSFCCNAEPVSAALTDPAPRTSLNLLLFGLSYHPDRQGARDRQVDNELNLGLGVSYDFQNDLHGVMSADAGFYKDSGSQWAKFAGLTYQFKLGQRWRLGGDLLVLQSATYNQGKILLAPIPHLTVDFGFVKVNAIYIPKFQQYDLFEVFAVYLTIPLMTW